MGTTRRKFLISTAVITSLSGCNSLVPGSDNEGEGSEGDGGGSGSKENDDGGSDSDTGGGKEGDDGNWRSFGYDLVNSSSLSGKGPVENVGVSWSLKTGGGCLASPAVVDGNLYVPISNVESGISRIHAVSVSEGENEWTTEVEGAVWSSPAVFGNSVYFGTDAYSLNCLDASTGDEKWSFDTGHGKRLSHSVHSPPSVTQDSVYFQDLGPQGGHAYSISTGGNENWSFEVGEKGGNGGGFSSPAVSELVYFTTMGGKLYAVTEEGEEEFTFDTGSVIRSSPAVSDGVVYFGSGDSNLYAVSTESGSEKWRFGTAGPVDSSPAVDGDSVYIGSYDSNLYAVTTSAGTEKWSFETDGRILSSPTVVGDTVYVGSHDSNLYAVDAETGEERWSFDTGAPVLTSPVVIPSSNGGTVYVTSSNGNVYALQEGEK